MLNICNIHSIYYTIQVYILQHHIYSIVYVDSTYYFMNFKGSFTATTVHAMADQQSTITQTIQMPPQIEQAITLQEQQVQTQLQTQVRALQTAIIEKHEPSKIESLFTAIKNIAPDVAEVVAKAFADPLSLIGLTFDKLCGK